jgi:alpha-methylacyl-CoA racemase
MFWAMKAGGMWGPERGTNMLDTGAPFYDVYECSDGTYISIGSIEPQFYAELMELSGLGKDADFPPQMTTDQWPAMKERVAEVFKTKSRAQWCEIMEHSDVCFAPVLSMEEATEHPHNVERGTFVEYHGLTQAAPAPRFSRTSPELTRPAPHAGQHTDEVLAQFGFDAEDVAKLHQTDAVS